MSESFGGDLRFSSGSDMSFGGGDAPASGPDLSPQGPGSVPSEPAEYPPQPSAQPAGPSFGGMLKSILPGPNYRTPDPASSPLDQASELLEQRVKRASSIATNPLAQFFSPESVQKARDFIPQAAEQLQKIQQQKSAIAAGRVQAGVLGLEPGEVSDQASADDRMQVAMAKALKGDMRAFQGIQAIAPERAAAIAGQVHEVVAGHLEKAQYAFDSLAGMQNQGQYAAKLQELRQNGTLSDLESLGMKVPPNFDAFGAVKAKEGQSLREARIGIDAVRQKLEERNTYQPMEKKEAETYNGRLTTALGDQITNGQWGRNGASGTRGLVINGAADPNDLGKKFTLATPEQRKAIKEEFDGTVAKTELEKNRNFKRIGTLATTGTDGKFIPPEGVMRNGQKIYLNDNPNIQQGLSEGFAAELRGGQGGATGGLLNIESGKRGAVQALLDKINAGYGGALNTITGTQVRSYLTQLTQQQQRQVLDGLEEYNQKSLGSRVTAIAQRAGALGLDSAALGLGKDEAKGAVADALEAGRQAQIERMKPYHQAIGGGDGVMQLGAQRGGAGATALPPGTDPTNQLPGAAPLLTPVQQAQQPPQPGAPAPQNTPTAPQPPASGGGGQPAPSPLATRPQDGGAVPPVQPKPLTIAGETVNAPALPAGLSPDYLRKTQRIESGNEKEPWKAGSKLSSAGGAFQFIKSTWAADKPPGAPDSAKEATPQQQADAAATRAHKNAAALTRNGLPVNDTNAYIAHNLGEGAGPKLLQADPNADARTVVGDRAASNNPKFFRGKPTVATVLARYQTEMDKGASPAPDDSGPQPRPGAGGATASADKPGLMSRVADVLSAGAVAAVPGGPLAKLAWDRLTPEQRQQVKDTATDNLPAIGSTVGAVGGGALGSLVAPGPGTLAGGVAGGAAGGGAGQALKDYLKGGPQRPGEIAKQAALGGVLGIMPAGRPVLGAAARVLGAGAVEGGAKAAEGADAADVADATGRGMVEGAGGELFGRALGMVGHKVYSMFTPDAQVAVRAAAKSYAEAVEALRTEAPKLPGAGGTAATVNPKYAAAEAAKEKAEITLKDAGLKPEEAAYAHKVTTEGVPKQAAQAAKPGALEEQRIGAGYQQLESEVGAAGVGAPKAAPKLADGPIAAVEGKQVSAAHKELAERTEMAITAPAANWQEKWIQLKEARSTLLQAERDALSSTESGRTRTAADMRTLADTVRAQQEKAAKYVFGEKDGAAFMDRLKVLDVRYRRLMEATGGGGTDELLKAATLKGEAGREADRRFKAFAHDDPVALEAWASMRKQGVNLEKGVHDLVAAERFPVLGKAVSAVKLAASFNQWMRDRAAGGVAKFEDFIKMGDGGARATRDIAGSTGARVAVQGDVLNGAAP